MRMDKFISIKTEFLEGKMGIFISIKGYFLEKRYNFLILDYGQTGCCAV